MEETFDEKRRRYLVERFGVAKGNRLADEGNTIVVVEHNLDVIKNADYVMDLGPEGGDEGGYIIAQGTPEEVAQVRESCTGQFLKKVLS